MSNQTEQTRQSKIFTIPNVLTMIRFILIPVYWKMMLDGRIRAALIVYGVACLTDMLDGFLARTLHQITNFGKLADPLADKGMVLSVLLTMILPVGGHEPVLPLAAFLLILAKELYMLVGSILLYRHRIVVYSRFIGKAAQFTMVCALLCSFFYDYFNGIGFPLHIYLLWTAAVLHLWAAVSYTVHFVRTYHAQKQAGVQNEQ